MGAITKYEENRRSIDAIDNAPFSTRTEAGYSGYWEYEKSEMSPLDSFTDVREDRHRRGILECGINQTFMRGGDALVISRANYSRASFRAVAAAISGFGEADFVSGCNSRWKQSPCILRNIETDDHRPKADAISPRRRRKSIPLH